MKLMIRLAVVCPAVFVLAVLLPARAHAGFIYWTDWDAQKIQRSGLDGSGVTDIVTGLSGPVGIALDLRDTQVGGAVPEPTAATLFGIGGAVVAVALRRVR
jgi:hypothetical protein